MAGDWIPCELGLFGKREVLTIARRTRRSRFEVAGLLLAFWGWFSTESADGTMPGVDLDSLADIVGGDRRFWQAVADERWVKATETGLEIPNAERWITKGAKARLQKNRRQADWRGGHVDGRTSTDPPTAPPTGPSRKASTTVQKRRESINRSTQKHRVQDDPPRPSGAVQDRLDDPDPDGTLTLTIEQQRLVNELRDLTGETDRAGLYRAVVARLEGHVFRVLSELRQAINDRSSRVENRGALFVEIAKRVAAEVGIVLFPRRAA